MTVLPGVLGTRTLRRTGQVRLGFKSLRLPGGMAIFTVSRHQFVKHPGSVYLKPLAKITYLRHPLPGLFYKDPSTCTLSLSSFQSPFENSRGIPGLFVFSGRIPLCNGRIILLMVHRWIHQGARLPRMQYRRSSSFCSQSLWKGCTSDLVQLTCTSFSSRVDNRHFAAWNKNTDVS